MGAKPRGWTSEDVTGEKVSGLFSSPSWYIKRGGMAEAGLFGLKCN